MNVKLKRIKSGIMSSREMTTFLKSGTNKQEKRNIRRSSEFYCIGIFVQITI